MENKGHLQSPIYRFMDHTDLQQLHAESVKTALNKQKSLPPTQMWAEAWHRRKTRSSAPRLAPAERKPNTMQPIHSIFFIAALRAAVQCFPIKTTAIYQERQDLAGNTPIISAMKRK